MQIINMTPDCAKEIIGAIKKILEADPGLALEEIELRAGDPGGRGDEPTDEVEVHVRYTADTIIGCDGN